MSFNYVAPLCTAAEVLLLLCRAYMFAASAQAAPLPLSKPSFVAIARSARRQQHIIMMARKLKLCGPKP
jgi:hypothetical protein